jgi:hypothetical protein
VVNPCPADAKVRTLLRSWLSAPKTSKNCSGIQKREIPWCPRLHLWIGITATRGTPAHLAIAGGTGPRRIHSPARGRSLSVYPILFLYCHHVELTLKNLILAGRSSEEHRARRRSTSRVRSIPQEHDDLLKRFLQATGKGEMAGMVALLSKDAALHSDGGGRATALPNLIHGADSIPRAIVHGLRKLVPMERVNRIVQIFRASAILDFMGSCFDLLNHFNWVREQSYSSQAVHLITGVTQLSFSAASIAGSHDGPSGCYGVAPVWLENLATPG